MSAFVLLTERNDDGQDERSWGKVAAKRAYWGKHITEWEHSEQTQRAFRAQRGLARSTFQWWRMRGKERQAMKSTTPFLPIAMGAMSAMNVVEVELRSRTRMRFEGEAALQAVAQLAELRGFARVATAK